MWKESVMDGLFLSVIFIISNLNINIYHISYICSGEDDLCGKVEGGKQTLLCRLGNNFHFFLLGNNFHLFLLGNNFHFFLLGSNFHFFLLGNNFHFFYLVIIFTFFIR